MKTGLNEKELSTETIWVWKKEDNGSGVRCESLPNEITVDSRGRENLTYLERIGCKGDRTVIKWSKVIKK